MSPPPPLIGTYTPPRIRMGQRVDCNYRGVVCRVVSLTSAPIPWPRVSVVGQKGGGGLWVDDTLERAIRTESGVAVAYWFGVSENTARRWRRWAGVGGHAGTPGTQAAVRGASEASARVRRGVERPVDERARMSERARRLNQVRFMHARLRLWTPAVESLLGTAPDAEVARRIGRTPGQVYFRRWQKGIPKFGGKT